MLLTFFSSCDLALCSCGVALRQESRHHHDSKCCERWDPLLLCQLFLQLSRGPASMHVKAREVDKSCLACLAQVLDLNIVFYLCDRHSVVRVWLAFQHGHGVLRENAKRCVERVLDKR